MIVYYNPDNFTISGMSWKLDNTVKFPHFETDDIVAEKIFLGKEKITLYKVLIEDDKGYLVKRSIEAKTKHINDQFYLVKREPVEAELTITQDCTTKQIIINLDRTVYDSWRQQVDKKNNIELIACVPNDPFQPLWNTFVPIIELDSRHVINYQGTDNICFYTEKLFESYSHERIESSRS